RAGVLSIGSVTNGLVAAATERKFKKRLRESVVAPPIFILGHWRSGTTFLQQLLALDPRFAFPTFYEVVFPRGFLQSEDANSELYSKFLPSTRVFDNMENNFASPSEDEFALAAMCGLSPYMTWAFPRNAKFYDRFLTFADATPAERALWRGALRDFCRRLTVRHARPLVLKSPPHTARIKLILETFPDAKFIHIHRTPYKVLPSTKRMLEMFLHTTQLQSFDFSTVEDHVFRQYREMYDAFFEQRSLIPDDRFFEVGFNDLQREPLARLEALYDRLSLPDFAEARPHVEKHLTAVKDYQKNTYPEMPLETRRRIKTEWGRTLDAWGYEDPWEVKSAPA
ncbi:MAG: sulfotransferase family protein, partial [Planctomycetia bacterium]